MRVAALQYDIAWMDKAANAATVRRMLASANLPRGDGFALLPEMFDTGFTMDAAEASRTDSLPAAQSIARESGVWLQAGYAMANAGGGPPSNAAVILDPQGAVRATYRKMHLFSPGQEHAHYAAGDGVTVIDVPSDQGSWKVCPLVCYDLRFPEVWRLAALAGAELFVIGASWPAARAHHWHALLVARAIENQAYVLACNRIGHDPACGYSGGSMIVAPSGEVIAHADDREAALVAELDRDALLKWRERFPALRDTHRSLLGSVAVDPTRA
ncbi:MAG: nitrilase-related carbon-nitrogen hydrolase [Phycisphaerales bacterium]